MIDLCCKRAREYTGHMGVFQMVSAYRVAIGLQTYFRKPHEIQQSLDSAKFNTIDALLEQLERDVAKAWQDEVNSEVERRIAALG